MQLGGQAVAHSEWVKEGTDESFIADVVEASKEVPVIVDFWATWCGPCRTLGPALEAAVNKAKGAVRMVKIDVDRHQAYAGQLRVQSIPTVYAFWQGQPVDGFQGAIPGSQIDDFVNKLVGLSGGAGLDAALDEADAMLAAGELEGAEEVYGAVLSEEPENGRAYAGLVNCALVTGDLDKAEALVAAAPAAVAKALEAAKAQIALARQAASAGPEAELQAAVEANPNDHQARFDLATALHANGKTAEAVEQLLELFRRDREWNEGAAKAQLFQIFDALKPNDPVVLNGRRKLSSLLFA